jgi:hypothetical protein
MRTQHHQWPPLRHSLHSASMPTIKEHNRQIIEGKAKCRLRIMVLNVKSRHQNWFCPLFPLPQRKNTENFANCYFLRIQPFAFPCVFCKKKGIFRSIILHYKLQTATEGRSCLWGPSWRWRQCWRSTWRGTWYRS